MKRARFWIGIIISLLCLFLAFKDIRPAAIGAALSRANYEWLIPALGLTVLAQVGRAARWGSLFYPRRDLRLSRLFSTLSIGYLISNIFPARLGDIARAYLISNSDQVPLPRSLSTVVVERAFDALAIGVLLIALLPFVPLPPTIARPGLIIGGLAVAGIVGLLVLSWQQERSLRWLHAILVRLPRLDAELWTARARSLIEGFAVVHTPQPLFQVSAWTFIVWLLAALTYFVLMQAFTLPLAFPLSFGAALLLLCALGVGATVPSSPGYIGVFHAVTVFALSVFAIDKNLALSYAIILHGLNYITLTAIGAYYAFHESISIWRLEDEVSAIEGKG